MGGLRIFGTRSRVTQEPKTMRQKAATTFAKYHELKGRVLDRMETQKTKMRIFLFLMLAKRAQETKEKTGVNKDLDELDGRNGGTRKRHHPVGINQDARGWFNECGRPRYPLN